MVADQKHQRKITTYYNILEIDDHPDNVDPLSIKNAYKRLALRYHPDRNNGDKTSTEKFHLIGEAFQILSHEKSRKAYDRQLRRYKLVSKRNPSKRGVGNTRSDNGAGVDTPQNNFQSQTDDSSSGSDTESQSSSEVHKLKHPSSPILNPFAQFNDVFRNDPFFNKAYEEGDAVERKSKNSSLGNRPFHEGLFVSFLKVLGVSIETKTVANDGNGNVSESQFSSSGATLRTMTCERKSRTYIDKKTGQQVRIQTIERNGNHLEEKYIDNQLVEQRVNGNMLVASH